MPRLRSWKLSDPAVISNYHNIFQTKAVSEVSRQVDNPVGASWYNLRNPLLEATKENFGIPPPLRSKLCSNSSTAAPAGRYIGPSRLSGAVIGKQINLKDYQ